MIVAFVIVDPVRSEGILMLSLLCRLRLDRSRTCLMVKTQRGLERYLLRKGIGHESDHGRYKMIKSFNSSLLTELARAEYLHKLKHSHKQMLCPKFQLLPESPQRVRVHP